MTTTRRTPLLLLAALAALVAIISLAGPASAHTGTTATAGPEGRTLITYSFSHGCSGAATIGLRVQLPAGATSVIASNPEGWSSVVSATEIRWTGPAIADGVSATFDAAMVLTQPAGTTIVLPNIQECTGGAELAWIGTPSADAGESSRPAPTIVVPENASVAPIASPVTTVVASTTTSLSGTARMATETNAITEAGSAQSEAGRWVFLGVCAVIVIGAGVLYLKYRTPTAKN